VPLLSSNFPESRAKSQASACCLAARKPSGSRLVFGQGRRRPGKGPGSCGPVRLISRGLALVRACPDRITSASGAEPGDNHHRRIFLVLCVRRSRRTTLPRRPAAPSASAAVAHIRNRQRDPLALRVEHRGPIESPGRNGRTQGEQGVRRTRGIGPASRRRRGHLRAGRVQGHARHSTRSGEQVDLVVVADVQGSPVRPRRSERVVAIPVAQVLGEERIRSSAVVPRGRWRALRTESTCL